MKYRFEMFETNTKSFAYHSLYHVVFIAFEKYEFLNILNPNFRLLSVGLLYICADSSRPLTKIFCEIKHIRNVLFLLSD